MELILVENFLPKTIRVWLRIMFIHTCKYIIGQLLKLLLHYDSVHTLTYREIAVHVSVHFMYRTIASTHQPVADPEI